jgi:hypothetical protein
MTFVSKQRIGHRCKHYKQMNDIHVYSVQTYEKQISHDYYCQIVTYEVCNICFSFFQVRLMYINNMCVIKVTNFSHICTHVK